MTSASLELELDAPFSNSKLTRQRTFLTSGGRPEEGGGHPAGRRAISFDDDGDADDAGEDAEGAREAVPSGARATPYVDAHRTPSTLPPAVLCGDGGRASGLAPGGTNFLTLEEYAEMERRSAMRRAAGGDGR